MLPIGVGPFVASSQPPTFDSRATASTEHLPADVFADSRNRLPIVKRDELDQLGKQLYDDTAGNARLLAGFRRPGGIHTRAKPSRQPASRDVDRVGPFHVDGKISEARFLSDFHGLQIQLGATVARPLAPARPD